MTLRRYTRQTSTIPERSTQDDFSGGIIGGISDRRVRPKHLRKADNLIGRPHRALRVRSGSRDISSAVVGLLPHSLAKYYTSGASKLFVAADVKWYEVTSSTYTLQTLPFTPSSTDKWSSENLNAVMWTTQRGGSQLPLMYNGGWLEAKLPTPGNTLTLTQGTGGNMGNTFDAGGLTGTYYYRLRWRHTNGCSVWSTPQSVVLTAASSHTKVTVSTIPLGARSDYIGWSLYRTKGTNQDGASGVFYEAAEGTATSYVDTNADASLFYASDNGIHGEPPHLDGVIPFAGRLCGWAGSTVYMSQLPGDLEATGLCNWDSDLAYNFAKDDGDSIQCCLVLADQMLVLKKRSVHILDGNMPENFQVRALLSGSAARGSEAGCVGPRAACVIGQSAYFWGDGGMFRYRAGSVIPFGWVEVGHYVDTLTTSAKDDIVLVNYLGDFLLAWYPANGSTLAGEMLVWDARFNNWQHWTNWFAKDALVQKDGAFSSATLIFCDPRPGAPTTLPVSNPSFVAWSDSRSGTSLLYRGIKASDGTDVSAANGVLTGTNPSIGALGVCADDTTGFFAAWSETNGANYDVRVNHFDAAGAVAAGWSSSGTVIRSGLTGACTLIRVVTDGSGGCIVAWADLRAAAPRAAYVQRVNSAGTAQWTANGVAAFDGTIGSAPAELTLIASGAGGAFVVVGAFAAAGPSAQLVNSSGAVQWGAAGKLVGAGNVQRAAACLDNLGGIYVSFTTSTGAKLFRLDASGAFPTGWASGVTLSSAAAGNFACCVSDGGTGCIAGWQNAGFIIRTQKVNSAGNVVWTVGGIQVSTSQVTASSSVRMMPDGSGGAFVVWSADLAGGANDNVYANHVGSAGTLPWGSTPVAVCGAASKQSGVHISTDGGGGFIATWCDTRSGNADVYAQRMNGDGTAAWAADGVVVASGTGAQGSGSLDGQAIAFTQSPDNSTSLGATAGYHVWAGFDSFLDEKSSTGTGGKNVPVYIEGPMVDDGSPSSWKRYERVQAYIDATVSAVSASLVLDPTDLNVPVRLALAAAGSDWAVDALDTNPNAGVWDVSDWGTEGSKPATGGLPLTSTGQRYSLRLSLSASGDMVYYGHEIDYVLMPERRLDR